jgi:nitrate/TMAO reductase-like tetraheme cytochrome c subunit
MRLSFPRALRNPLSLIGMAITTVMAMVFLVLVMLDAFGLFHNPYFGLLLFVAVPAAFLVGLILIPLGARRARRRQQAGAEPAGWPVFDLRNIRHRRLTVMVIALTCINVVILSLAAFGAAHYMETNSFCGQVCHEPMEPQFVAHQTGPHARVGCVDCHIGPGGRPLVQAKLNGTRQLWHVATGNVPRPVPSPRELLSPPEATCATCHWAEQFHGSEQRVFTEYADDERNTETATVMTLLVGGGTAAHGVGTGIHWHMNLDNEIEYIATNEKRETIPYVRLKTRDGQVREYFGPGSSTGGVPAGERRSMNCLDCHSRPAHTFFATPQRAVDSALAQGLIPKELPFVRREAVAAVATEYPDKEAALQAIAARLRKHYNANPSADARLVDRAVAGAQDVWARNVFPKMNVRWGTYPNQIGHVDSPGCFRCHDDEHKTADGRVIKQDCEMCHTQQE